MISPVTYLRKEVMTSGEELQELGCGAPERKDRSLCDREVREEASIHYCSREEVTLESRRRDLISSAAQLLAGLSARGSSRNRTCRGPVYSQPCHLDSSTALRSASIRRDHADQTTLWGRDAWFSPAWPLGWPDWFRARLGREPAGTYPDALPASLVNRRTIQLWRTPRSR